MKRSDGQPGTITISGAIRGLKLILKDQHPGSVGHRVISNTILLLEDLLKGKHDVRYM